MFNPTKILLHPSYFVWKSLTLTPNPWRSSLSGAACTPPEIFPPLLLKNENPPLCEICYPLYLLESVVYEKVKKVLTKKRLKSGIQKASTIAQTSCLEGFHSVLNHFAPKMIAFLISWNVHQVQHFILTSC